LRICIAMELPTVISNQRTFWCLLMDTSRFRTSEYLRYSAGTTLVLQASNVVWTWGRLDSADRGFVVVRPTYRRKSLRKKADYDPRKLDVWSCAIVWFTLFYSGTPWCKATLEDPRYVRFLNSYNEWMARQEGQIVTEDSYDFPTYKAFSNLKTPMKRLMYRMTHPNPDKRITIQQVVADRWIQSVECCTLDALQDHQPCAINAAVKGACKTAGKCGIKKIHGHLPPPKRSIPGRELKWCNSIWLVLLGLPSLFYYFLRVCIWISGYLVCQSSLGVDMALTNSCICILLPNAPLSIPGVMCFSRLLWLSCIYLFVYLTAWMFGCFFSFFFLTRSDRPTISHTQKIFLYCLSSWLWGFLFSMSLFLDWEGLGGLLYFAWTWSVVIGDMI